MSEKIIPGVGAVVFRGNDVLLIRRGMPPFKGQWSIPGGRVEYGERLEEAAAREVREETAVDIRILGLLGVYDSLPRQDQPHHYLLIDYVAEWVAGEPRAGDDAEAAEFVPLEDALARVSWDTTRGALRKAAELHAGVLSRS